MGQIKLNVTDGRGGMLDPINYNFSAEISLEWIKGAAYMEIILT